MERTFDKDSWIMLLFPVCIPGILLSNVFMSSTELIIKRPPG